MSQYDPFYQFLEFGHGSRGGRWAFHQEKGSIETDLDRGWSRAGRLYITLQQDASHTATFNLCSLDFPMRELFDTFSEQTGFPVSSLQFSYEGKRLDRGTTPRLCGMTACPKESPHVVKVEHADGQRRRQQLLAALNRMGGVVDLCEETKATKFAIGSDLLSKAMMPLPVEDLLSTTLVNVYWFHATQRLSLMLQLRHGDLTFLSAPPKAYTAWLASVSEHSQRLAFADAQSRLTEVEAWKGLNATKARTRPAYAFTKAAGCRQMKTVDLEGLPADFEAQWLSLHSSKAKFMAECKGKVGGTARNQQQRLHQMLDAVASKLETTSCEISERNVSTSNEEAQETQAFPPPGSTGFVADAVSPEFREVAIELFRRYFSPDMYFIFPLIVHKECAFGLDFSTTSTSLFFGPRGMSDEVPVAPVGACSWRLRRPLFDDRDLPGDTDIGKPVPVLEVLFIAVWEEERHQIHGGTLVAEVEACARRAEAGMLYVEIGFEQPKAREFWEKQGFQRVQRERADTKESDIVLSQAQLTFFENNCLRFSDTEQYVLILR